MHPPATTTKSCPTALAPEITTLAPFPPEVTNLIFTHLLHSTICCNTHFINLLSVSRQVYSANVAELYETVQLEDSNYIRFYGNYIRFYGDWISAIDGVVYEEVERDIIATMGRNRKILKDRHLRAREGGQGSEQVDDEPLEPVFFCDPNENLEVFRERVNAIPLEDLGLREGGMAAWQKRSDILFSRQPSEGLLLPYQYLSAEWDAKTCFQVFSHLLSDKDQYAAPTQIPFDIHPTARKALLLQSCRHLIVNSAMAIRRTIKAKQRFLREAFEVTCKRLPRRFCNGYLAVKWHSPNTSKRFFPALQSLGVGQHVIEGLYLSEDDWPQVVGMMTFAAEELVLLDVELPNQEGFESQQDDNVPMLYFEACRRCKLRLANVYLPSFSHMIITGKMSLLVLRIEDRRGNIASWGRARRLDIGVVEWMFSEEYFLADGFGAQTCPKSPKSTGTIVDSEAITLQIQNLSKAFKAFGQDSSTAERYSEWKKGGGRLWIES
ncbi:hypothetical protein I350_05765 [Cryptococcus amylolentus CBS 6273]|uniref:Uncharacterized protein n=1 Tax=Cryptococcus amylolentus CBS 6273 TaxID=1296118 RepID=A0A1E3JQ23_9TREE|nr:hypothetical protein I350_05765 [Cryptococcus amylolentus CBS 6273]